MYTNEFARVIQFDITLYDDLSDLYARFTLSLERLDIDRWWISTDIHPARLLGLFGYGNYHGPMDDVQMVVIPVIEIILILFFLYTNWQLSRVEGRQRILSYLLCLGKIGLIVGQLYLNV